MCSLTLEWQSFSGKENSEFKPVKLRLKFDFVSHPAYAEELAYIYIYIYIYVCMYIRISKFTVKWSKSVNYRVISRVRFLSVYIYIYIYI